MKDFFVKYKNLPLTVKRFADISVEPLFACNEKKKNLLSCFLSKKVSVCRKWNRKKTVKCLCVILPIAIMLIFTGGICISVKEKSSLFKNEEKCIKKDFTLSDKSKPKSLLVVNSKTPIPKDYSLNLANYNTIKCDGSIIKSVDSLIADARKEGYDFELFKGFIDEKDVEKMYNDKVEELLNEGYTVVRAESQAEKLVSSPSKSEYETGLLIDIKAKNKNFDEFVASPEYKWLLNNCVDYGFIQRYPVGKEDKTGKDFSPFAFRFVGVEDAKKMRSISMCLEEYVRYLKLQ